MPVPKRRHSSARRDKARTHKKLHAKQLTTCSNCNAPKLAHRICATCGHYRGRSYRTIVTK